MSTDDSKKRKPGRPSKEDQEKIRKEIWRLRGRGLSHVYIIEKTGFDKDTVYKYCKDFESTYIHEDGKTIVERYADELYVTRHSLDKLTDHAFDMLDYAKNEITNAKDKNEKPDKYFFDLQLQTINTIGKLHSSYQAISLVPNPKDIVDEVKRQLEADKKREKSP